MRIWSATFVMGAALVAEDASAKPISDGALYRKCYAQMTNTSVSTKNLVYQEVVKGQKDPIDACMDVLRGAILVGSTRAPSSVRLENVTAESKAVLRRFYALHYSWLSTRTFTANLVYQTIPSTMDVLGESSPATYWTRALLDPSFAFGQVLTTKESLMPIRKNMNPGVGAFSGKSRSIWDYKGDFDLAPTGELLGIRGVPPIPVTQPEKKPPSFELFFHAGGGVMGFSPYLRYNLKRKNVNVDQMPREWSIAVLRDLLCREAPVVRDEDTLHYVDESSELPFRINSGCVRCHATLDQMSAVVRHVRYTPPIDYRKGGSGSFPYPVEVTADPEKKWPIGTDIRYGRRPTTGHLMLRTFDGELVSKKLQNLDDLGQTLAGLDDPYVCVAKRYFEAFTGIQVPLGDFDDPDPNSGRTLSKPEQFFWEEVVGLGENLKDDPNQDPMTLIEEILRKPYYADSDPAGFGSTP